jgi:hypothetical protein
LSIRRRLLRTQIFRHHPPQYESLLHLWGSILGPFLAGAFYDRTQSYQMVFAAITVALLISTTMTALLIKPWANLETSARMRSNRTVLLNRMR